MDCKKCDEHKVIVTRIDSLDKAVDKQNKQIDDLYKLIYTTISEQKLRLSLICGGFSLLGSIIPLFLK